MFKNEASEEGYISPQPRRSLQVVGCVRLVDSCTIIICSMLTQASISHIAVPQPGMAGARVLNTSTAHDKGLDALQKMFGDPFAESVGAAVHKLDVLQQNEHRHLET